MRDMLHCLGFLDMLRVDLLPLTAESQGQLGLTPSNPLGHLESPRCTAHQDYPTPSYTSRTWDAQILKGHRGHFCAPTPALHTHICSPTPFSVSLMPVVYDADPVNGIRWKAWLGTGLYDLYSGGYGSWLHPLCLGWHFREAVAPEVSWRGWAEWLEDHLLSPLNDLWWRGTIAAPVRYIEWWRHDNISALCSSSVHLGKHGWKWNIFNGMSCVDLLPRPLPFGHTVETCSPRKILLGNRNVWQKAKLSTVFPFFSLAQRR